MTLKPSILVFSLLILSCLSHSQITINEINYRSIAPEENIEFIELYNHSDKDVNLINWHFTSGITFSFSENVIIKPDSFLILAGNPKNCAAFFKLSSVLGPWSGKLSNSGDIIELRNPNFEVIDKVGYDGWKEWPSINYEDSKIRKDTPRGTVFVPVKTALSIQKINPLALGKLPGSWRGELPTPGRKNSTVLIENISNTPIIKKISRSINSPTTGKEVTVLAELTNVKLPSSEISMFLDYQIVEPGNYISRKSQSFLSGAGWIRINMEPINTTDEISVFSAIIPEEVQEHRRLIRYKVSIKTKHGFKAYYPDKKHRESNYAYYVNDGQKTFNGVSFNDLSELQSLELITSDHQTNQFILKGVSNDYRGEGTLVYGGKVYDHILFRARGKNSRHHKVKRNLKFALNDNRPLTPKNDFGVKYDQPRNKVALSGGWVNDCNSHGLTEAIIYKTSSLIGGFNKHTDYCQLRIIDQSEEGGNNGDFWGVYQIIEDWGGTMLAEHNLPDGNIYTYKDWTLSHQGENGPFGQTNEAYTSWNDGIGDSKNGSSSDKRQDVSLDFIIQNLDLEHYFADLLLNELIGNGETNYMGQHSYREYYNPETKKWIAQCGDYDEAFGSSHNKLSVYPRSESRTWRNMRGLLKKEVLEHDSLKIMFSNMLRSTIDLLVNEEQLRMLLKNESSVIYNESHQTNWTDLDYARWSNAEGSEMDYEDYKKEVIDWYYNWFFARVDHLLQEPISYNNYNPGEEKTSPTENIYHQEEQLAPDAPTINYTGKKEYALNLLSFNCSDFRDNTGDFGAIEWRVGEWSDPNNKSYANNSAPVYEVENYWNSGELPQSATDFTIPPEAKLKKGKSYKIRARYKDNTNRWSHWSSPFLVTPSDPTEAEVPNLNISELMFDPVSECGVEYIKLTNHGFFSTDLTNIEFTDGIFYSFPIGSSIAGNGSLILTKDSVKFIQKYGFSPYGEYKNSLANKGENIRLTGAYGQLINEVHYLKDDTWKTKNNGCSLLLKDSSKSNQTGKNWTYSKQQCGTPSLGAESNYTRFILLVLLIPLIFWIYYRRRKKSFVAE